MSAATERQLTAWLADYFPRRPARVPVGIGDDAAVVRNLGPDSVVACDPVVAGVHFTDAAPLALVGRKAVNRNLSDLAAMGAVPDYLLVSVLLPRGFAARRRGALFRGVRDAARAAGCDVVGGDVAGTPGPLTVTVTAIGHLAGRALRRSAAAVGDALHVSGALGGAALGRHLRFAPELALGRWLARQAAVGAVIDVSDGLALDLQTVLAASACPGAVLDAAAVPISAAARRQARRSGRSALAHALGDGEDHVLLFSVRRGKHLRAGGPLAARARRPIGEVVAAPGLALRERDGRLRRLEAVGFQHAL